METIRIHTLDDLKSAAKKFTEQVGNHEVFALYGEMGVGKTTFIKAVCRELGVKENMSSPSFALINAYTIPNGKSIFHFDCYRLKNIREAYDIGAEEYFNSGNYCFIEWPEIIEELLPDDSVKVLIKLSGKGHERLISIVC